MSTCVQYRVHIYSTENFFLDQQEDKSVVGGTTQAFPTHFCDVGLSARVCTAILTCLGTLMYGYVLSTAVDDDVGSAGLRS